MQDQVAHTVVVGARGRVGQGRPRLLGVEMSCHVATGVSALCHVHVHVYVCACVCACVWP